tara:strand:- start:235 stop:813 length:579 start_codon:yes stop_codon:yes gene_type:complete
MRSIVHKKDNTKRNQIILGVFLIVVMTFGTFAYAFGSSSNEDSNEKIEYKGIEFVRDNSGYWSSVIQGNEFITKYNPEETKEINFFSSLNINNYKDKPLYFVGEIGDGSSEIGRNLAERFVLRIQEACLDEDGCEGDLPIKNCSIDNVISFEHVLEEELETINQEENCVYIVSSLDNQSKYADKFLFEILGI